PGRSALAEAVARYYFKLLAYKDEYEVARLYTNGEFARQLAAEFEGDYKVQIHLAPPWSLNPRDAATGPHRQWTLRAWPPHRRLDRRLIRDYEARVEELLAGLSPETSDLAVEIARLPELVRGFD